MIKYTFILLSMVVLLLFSCEKSGKSVQVVRNCTGIYLRVNGKEYRVCNSEKLSEYPNGVSIKVSYKHIKKCNSDDIVCMMVYPNDGDIKVLQIK
jgi:transposase